MKKLDDSPGHVRFISLLIALIALELLIPSGHRAGASNGAPAQGSSPPQRIGVAMVPFMNGGDEVEQLMYQFMGQMPQVERVYTPKNADEFFDLLLKTKKMGKQVGFLAIAGHGAISAPGIQFSGGDLAPENVNLPELRKNLDTSERILKAQESRNADTTSTRQKIDELKRRIKFLSCMSEVMADKGVVLLINCSPAATPAGQTFVRNLGEVLLAKNGGTVIASKSDVSLGQVRSIANKIKARITTGEWLPIGDFAVSGDWELFPIQRNSASGCKPAGELGEGSCQDISGDWQGQLVVDSVSGPSQIKVNQKRMVRGDQFSVTQKECTVTLKFFNNEISGTMSGDTAVLKNKVTGAVKEVAMTLVAGRLSVVLTQEANAVTIVSKGSLAR